MSTEPDQIADLVAVLADALEAENVRCKISLWQKDESGYGFGPKGDPCPINLTYLAEFCVGVITAAQSEDAEEGEESLCDHPYYCEKPIAHSDGGGGV